jgi:hypothetical protein
MAFVLKQSSSYSWPVTVKVPAETGAGRLRSYTFEVEFQRISEQRREELIRQVAIQQGKLEAGLLTEDLELLTPRQMAAELVVGWSGILESEEPGAAEAPYSEATKSELLNIPDVAQAIIAAWEESIPGARRKN